MEDRRPEPAEERHPEHPAAANGGQDAPVGGDDTTEQQLDANNAVEEDALKALDPDDAPA